MSTLVYIDPGKPTAEPFTTSDIIATYAKIGYRSVQRIIETHHKHLSSFGRVRFEITPLQTKGGVQDKKIYRLNEQQATLLITFLKNTPVVVAFKVELVRQFYAMRSELHRRHAVRSEGKPIRRQLTDTIKALPDPKPWDFKNYTDLVYKSALGQTAAQLRKGRGAVKKAIAADFLRSDEMEAVSKTEHQVCVLIEMGLDYGQIKAMLMQRLQAIA